MAFLIAYYNKGLKKEQARQRTERLEELENADAVPHS